MSRATMLARKSARKTERELEDLANSLAKAVRSPQTWLAEQRVLHHPFSAEDIEKDEYDPAAKVRDKHAQVVEKLAKRQGSKPWFLLDPEGLRRRLWDFLAAVLIFVTLFYVPILIAFYSEARTCNYLTVDFRPNTRENLGVPGHRLSAFWQSLTIILNVFFLVDILVNFLTGVEVNAEDEGQEGDKIVDYRFPVICQAYLKSWFWVDFVACFPLECILQRLGPSINWYNLGRLVRLVRIIGLKRRTHGNPLRWVDLISDVRQEFSYTARRIANIVGVITIFVHIFACLLYFVVRIQNFPEVTWVVQLGIQEKSWIQQYLWSVFNAMSCLTSLSHGSFPPRTWPEALVWLIIMFTLTTLFAVMAGNITAALVSTTRGSAKFKTKMDQVMEVLHSRNLPNDLRRRVIQYYKFRYNQDQLLNEEAVLDDLPHNLRAAIAMHSSANLLRGMPLFANEPKLLEETSMLLVPTSVLAGESIVKEGWPCHFMYFIRSGYVDLLVDGVLVDTLQPGDWFGEAALLQLPENSGGSISPDDSLQRSQGLAGLGPGILGYRRVFAHPVSARALTNCTLFELDGRKFADMVQDDTRLSAELRRIALRHIERQKMFRETVRTAQRSHGGVVLDFPTSAFTTSGLPRRSYSNGASKGRRTSDLE